MSRIWSRPQTWLVLIAGAVGFVLAAVMGLHAYVYLTATPLHPNPQSVPTAALAVPSPRLTGPVDRARDLMRAAVTEQNLPGLSVAVGSGGEILWAEGFGWADLENRTPVTPDTRFRIGTASTVLTSAGVGLLLEQGRLKLDEPIQTYVPEYPTKPWPVTLRHLMGHVAGTGTDGGDEGPFFGQHCGRPVDALPTFADDALRFEPGTRYRYSSYGWIVVSAAAEAAAGEPFLTFMRKRVFAPLGMDATRADDAASGPNGAKPYFPRFAADPRNGPDPMRDIDLSCYAGAGTFVSTPSDLVRFGMAVNGGTLLQPATVQLLQTSQRLASGQDTGYGLGWDLETVELSGEQARTVGHDGEVLGGPVVSLVTFGERGLVVAVASNTSYADTSGLASTVARLFAPRGRDVTAPPHGAGRRP